jgi:heptaprenylglyceryl phosphate synthase
MTEDILRDFDDPEVFQDCQRKLVKPQTLNFVLEFGDEANIAFDLDKAAFNLLLNHDNPPWDNKRPVRWMKVSISRNTEALANWFTTEIYGHLTSSPTL